MPFIGNTPQTQSFAPAIDYFSGNGVTVTFTLSRPVVSVAQLTVAVDNVIQNPSSAFTVSGNSITFTSAPLSGTNNIWVEYTSLITTYAAISQDPSVIGDITATGGFLAEGDFGNSYIDGTIVDYVTGNARITTGPIDDMTFYHGGTASRSEMMKLSYAGNSTLTGNLAISGQASLGTGQTDYIAAIGGGGTARVEAVGGNTNINLSLSTKGTGATYFWRGGYGGTASMLIDGSGNVGIGTTSPSGKLHTYQTGNQDTNILFEAATAGYAVNTYLQGNNAAGSRYNNISSRYGSTYQWQIGGGGVDSTIMFKYGSSLTEAMRINSSGQVITGSSITGGTPQGDLNVIGATSTKTEFYMLKSGQVEGHIGFIAGSSDNWYFNTGPSLGTYGLYQPNNGTSWVSNSDERLKTDLIPIENGLEKVASLRSVTGRYKIDAEGVSRSFLIAQDVQAVLPEAVTKTRIPDDETEYLGVGYTDVIPLLVAAIKELKAEIDALKAGK